VVEIWLDSLANFRSHLRQVYTAQIAGRLLAVVYPERNDRIRALRHSP
jgi:hypothetical protein